MISTVYKEGMVYTYYEGNFEVQKEAEVYCRHDDLDKLPKNVPNGTFAMIMNWSELDSATQASLKSMVRVYDAQAKAWHAV